MLTEEKLAKQKLFTTTKKRIADYIRRSIETTVYMTTEELVEATYISHSAIICLCKKMDFSGFKKFRFELGREAHQLIAQFNQTTDPSSPFSSEDNTQQITKKVVGLSIQSIKKARLQIEHQDLESISKVLNNIQRIFLFTKGDSQVMARKLRNKIVKLNRFLILVEEHSNSSWNVADLASKDYVVFISYSGRIHHYEQIMIYLRRVGASMLLITGNQRSGMAKQANMYFVISQEEYDFIKATTFSFRIAFDYVLSTSFPAIHSQDFEESIRNLKNKQELVQKGLLKEYRRN